MRSQLYYAGCRPVNESSNTNFNTINDDGNASGKYRVIDLSIHMICACLPSTWADGEIILVLVVVVHLVIDYNLILFKHNINII